MKLFIKTGTVDRLNRKAEEGGGFEKVEVLITNDLKLVIPDETERKYWIELQLILTK